jgi:uncharacterized membrane protein
MSGVSIVKYAKDITTVFVCDLSDSTKENRGVMEGFITEALKGKTDHDIVGVIAFGDDSAIENIPSKDIIFNTFQTEVNSNFTNIQNGLLNASTIFPVNTRKRIVLITDGYENDGESERQLLSLESNQYSVDVVPIYKNDFHEVQISEIEIPSKASKNQTIDIVVHVESNVETEATMLIYSGNSLKYEQDIAIDSGENKYIFTDEISDGGLLAYRVEIIPTRDTYTENNSLSSYTIVEDEPYILVIQDEDEQGSKLIELFDKSANVEVMKPEEMPQEIASLIKYDAFILANISLEKLNEGCIESLESVVKYQGKGLLVTGGDSSYGLGGYYQTLLEEMLPVEADVKPKEEQPNLGLVLVIDKSGSMTSGRYGITKLELAKEAAIRSTEILSANDMLGVIGFDDSIKWVVDLQYAEDKEALQDMIGTIVPGGGTTIRPSLEAAVDSLIDADVTLKHIILLTDGQAETTGYEEIMVKLNENDITLSTVAVGESADFQLLNTLANGGGGRYYETDEFTDIPSIFTKEAFMAGKKYLNNITFTPNLVSYTSLFKGIETLPQLDGYVSTTVKENARLVLSGPEDDPILATMQYGLGKTVAWTSDANGLWTSQLFAWEGGATFWNNILSYIVNQDINSAYSVESTYENGEGVITVKSLGNEGSVSTMQGVIISPAGEEMTINLDASSPGEYTGNFIPDGEGVYMVDLTVSQGEENIDKIVTGVNVGYSLEYDYYSNDKIAFERIAEITGGRILNDPSDVFKGKVEEAKGSYDISYILLILALILLILEIAIRKTNIRFEKLGAFGRKLSGLASQVWGIFRSFSKNKATTKAPASSKNAQEIENSVVKVEPVELSQEEVDNQDERLSKKKVSQKTEQKAEKSQKKKKEAEIDTSHIDMLLKKKRK